MYYQNPQIWIPILYIFSWLNLNKCERPVFTRLISTVNAIQCVIGVMSVELLHYKSLDYQGNNSLIYTLQFFYVYLFTDGVFLLVNNEISVSSLLHHFVGGIGIYLMVKQRMGLGLGIYFAFTEISTPLLNLAWWFYINKVNNILSRAVFFLFWVVFTLSRILTIPLLWYYIDMNTYLVKELSIVNWVMVYGGSLTLISLNIVWFVMLTKKIFF